MRTSVLPEGCWCHCGVLSSSNAEQHYWAALLSNITEHALLSCWCHCELLCLITIKIPKVSQKWLRKLLTGMSFPRFGLKQSLTRLNMLFIPMQPAKDKFTAILRFLLKLLSSSVEQQCIALLSDIAEQYCWPALTKIAEKHKWALLSIAEQC